MTGELSRKRAIYGLPVGDVNPPCMGFLDDPDPPDADRPVSSTLTARPGLNEFSTEQGKKVTATW
jgi:hypothetical protein